MNIIDIHTHGIQGLDTRTVSSDDILKIAELHGSFGVTHMIPTIYPAPISTMRKNMSTVRKAMDMQKDSKGKRALIRGIYLEGPFLNRSQCGALDASSFLDPAVSALRELLDGFEDVVKIITVAPELEGSLGLITTISDMGINVSMGHSDATFAEAEAGYHAGARGITHLFNAMRGIHHREPGLAGFGLINQEIFIEVIADTLHINDEMIELIFSAKNHERIILISDSIKDTHSQENPNCTRSAKDNLSGGCMTLGESLKQLISRGMADSIIMSAVDKNPIAYLGLNT